MPHADFVHLRVHSAYSLSEGAIKADKIAALAREAGMPAVAITDTGQPVRRAGVQPGLRGQGRAADHRLPDGAGARGQSAPAARPIVLLAQDAAGLANLQRLSSLGFLDTDPGLKPQLAVGQRSRRTREGLILLTGGADGPVARLLAEGQKPEAERLLARVRRGVSRSRGAWNCIATAWRPSARSSRG